MDYTVHGILQARILEWAGFPFSRGCSQLRDWTQVSGIAGGFFTSWATKEVCYSDNKLFKVDEMDIYIYSSVQFSLVSQSCLTLCDSMDCSTSGLPVHHQLLEFTQTHVHWVGDAIQPSHPLPSPSPPTFNFAQHQGLFQWVSFLHQVARVLAFQLQHQSFQWISPSKLFRTDLL